MAEGNGQTDSYGTDIRREIPPGNWHPPTPKFTVDVANAPKITLAGMEFPIPLLAWKQNKIIEPLIRKIMPKLMKSYGVHKDLIDKYQAAKAKGETDLATMNEVLTALGSVEFAEGMEDDLATIAYTAITKAQPGFGRGEFENMPFGTNELVLAFNIIVEQTGAFRKTAAIEEPHPGETVAGNQSTGTSPLPTTPSVPASPGTTS